MAGRSTDVGVNSADGFKAVDSRIERLMRTQEIPGYGIAIDLVTVDNQLNLRSLRGP